MSPTQEADPSALSIHEFLRQHHKPILQAWENLVRSTVESARDLSYDDLINNFPDILFDIADEAERSDTAKQMRFPKRGPRHHAEHRVHQQFSLEEVVQEYSLLRIVILQILASLYSKLPTYKLTFLHEALDKAIIESVSTYASRSNEQLKSEQERLRVTLQSIGDGVVSTDTEGRVAFLNLAAEKISGWTQREAVGRPVNEVMTTIDEATHKTLEIVTHRAIEEKATFERPGGTLLRRYEGDLIPIEEHSSPLRNSEGEILGFVTTFRDVSKIRSLTSELSHLASHDPLTGLPNRTLLYDRLTRHLTHADRHTEMVAVLYLDLDLFKRVNDAHGHSTGDELLQQVAGRLLKCVRKTDTVSRLGGDEFAILLADFNQTAFPGEIGSKIIRKLRSSFILNQDTVNISASIGISLFPEDSHDAATLIKYADTAMYQAKESGRGHVQFFAQEMNERAVERRKLEKDLRTALEQNQLSLHFQPQIDLKTGGLVGVEALLRWQHPQRGFIPPDRFISVAEDNGDLMVLIGHWVLKHACAQVRLWLDAGHRPLRMSINVSIAQLRNEDFLPFLEGVLQNYRIPPDLLQVELTESIIMSDVMGAIDRIRGLKALGVHLAIDDFGTGYSSLSYLKMLPVNELKIDQSFVRKNLETGTDNATIIQAVIQMSQSLGLRVVAEGVETEEAVDFLIENKCDVAQGYYYSKALPAPIFERQFLCIRRS